MVPPKNSRAPNEHRWDKSTAQERRTLSAEVAAKEAAKRGLPALAPEAQHGAISRIIANAEELTAVGLECLGDERSGLHGDLAHGTS